MRGMMQDMMKKAEVQTINTLPSQVCFGSEHASCQLSHLACFEQLRDSERG